MGAYMNARYTVVCDNLKCDSKIVDMAAWGCRDAIDQAVAKGWVKDGRKVYCSACANLRDRAAAKKGEAAR